MELYEFYNKLLTVVWHKAVCTHMRSGRIARMKIHKCSYTLSSLLWLEIWEGPEVWFSYPNPHGYPCLNPHSCCTAIPMDSCSTHLYGGTPSVLSYQVFREEWISSGHLLPLIVPPRPPNWPPAWSSGCLGHQVPCCGAVTMEEQAFWWLLHTQTVKLAQQCFLGGPPAGDGQEVLAQG